MSDQYFFRALKTDAELEEFARRTEQYLDTRFPLEYLRRSRVVACVHRTSGSIEGGFLLALSGKMRSLEAVPHTERSNPEYQRFQNSTKVAEFNGLWMSKELSQRAHSLQLWLRVYVEGVRARLMGKTHFVYAFNVEKGTLGRVYQVARPVTLFQGITLPQPGMNLLEREAVQVIRISDMLKVPFRNPKFLGRRTFGRRSMAYVKRPAEPVWAQALRGLRAS